jgi:hypothetical protein
MYGLKNPAVYIGVMVGTWRPIGWAGRRAGISASRELPYRASTNRYPLHEMHARPQLICPSGLHPISPMFRHLTLDTSYQIIAVYFSHASQVTHLKYHGNRTRAQAEKETNQSNRFSCFLFKIKWIHWFKSGTKKKNCRTKFSGAKFTRNWCSYVNTVGFELWMLGSIYRLSAVGSRLECRRRRLSPLGWHTAGRGGVAWAQCASIRPP